MTRAVERASTPFHHTDVWIDAPCCPKGWFYNHAFFYPSPQVSRQMRL